MDLEREIDVYLRSRFTLLVVVTPDEERVIERMAALCERTGRQLLAWDHADYFRRVAGEGRDLPRARDALSALEAVESLAGEAVVLLPDFHQCWRGQSRVVRKLRNVAQRLKYTHKSIVIICPAADLPDELSDGALVLDVPPPGVDELEAILNRLLETPGVREELTEWNRDRVLRAALGLSSNQAERVFSKAIVTHGVLDDRDLELITAEKKQVIRSSGALELFTPQETLSEVGGLDELKEWLRLRGTAFTKDAREYGLPAPKGIALIGIPGTGKSLTARTVASLWRLPLVRLDMGSLFGSLVGQSEANTRRALQLVETIAPCVLWIDELEKGISTGAGDGGTSMRVLGTILSWMQDKTKPVFIVATANDVERLPPELLRRGRFDEVFFLDLPTEAERREIFEVHIRRRGRDAAGYDLDRLVDASEGYVGAEIESAVVDAMYIAFNDSAAPQREFTTDDVLVALGRLVPLSRSQHETVEFLRTWLHEGRAQSASFHETPEAERRFVPVLVDPN